MKILEILAPLTEREKDHLHEGENDVLYGTDPACSCGGCGCGCGVNVGGGKGST